MTNDQRRTAARLLAASRPRVEKTCDRCGTAFSGYPSQRPDWGTYCSQRCRQRAWLDRKRAAPAPASLDPPTIAELGGSDPDFTGDLSTDAYIALVRGDADA